MLRILKETPVPVVPLALSNLWGSMFSRFAKAPWKRLPRRYLARINWRWATGAARGSDARRPARAGAGAARAALTRGCRRTA